MKGYELTTEAQRDLDRIAEYIAVEASVDRAIKVLSQFRSAFRKLAEFPGLGHFREDVLDRRYRFWAVHSYLVAYRWDVTPIQVIAVVHGARDLDAFFGNRAQWNS
jgi:plasmid stabilization system protein ParE